MGTNAEPSFVYIRVHSWLRTQIVPPALLVHAIRANSPQREPENREWTLMDTNDKRNLFVCLRVYSWFWKNKLSGKGFISHFVRGSANE